MAPDGDYLDDAELAAMAKADLHVHLVGSAVATGVVATLADHPLPRLLAAGVPVVLGSDDPPMFATTLLAEYRRARDVLGLTAAQLRALARASIEASFAPAALKQRLLSPPSS
jgi:aminodeoxyfutalosine deaminase